MIKILLRRATSSYGNCWSNHRCVNNNSNSEVKDIEQITFRKTLLPASVYSDDALSELATKLNLGRASYASLPQSQFINIDFRKILAGCFFAVET